jgi:hypothetical protein
MSRPLARSTVGHSTSCSTCFETVTLAADGTWYTDESDPATATCPSRSGGYHLVAHTETSPPLEDSDG